MKSNKNKNGGTYIGGEIYVLQSLLILIVCTAVGYFIGDYLEGRSGSVYGVLFGCIGGCIIALANIHRLLNK